MEKKVTSRINKDLILRERLAIERTVMANHTTLLSFIRTSLYFAVAGLSLNNLLNMRYGFWIELACWVFSITILLIGIVNFMNQRKRLQASEKHIGDYKLEYESDS